MFKKQINRVVLLALQVIYRMWRKINTREFDPRKWSNDELRKFSAIFSGSIVNVSAGEDEDKECELYRNYFSNAKSYTTTNYRKISSNDLELDLNLPILNNSNLNSKFDAVFSHTVLEHMYDIQTAVRNLCRLSKDIVITVVPFLQAFHHEADLYHDYWRMSPYSLIGLFKENSLKTIYINWNDDLLGNIYIFHIASKNPKRWDSIRAIGQYNTLRGPGYFRQMLLSNTSDCPRVMIHNLNESM